MTLEEAIAAMPHLIDDREKFKKIVTEARRTQMIDEIKQMIANCVRTAYESSNSEGRDIAREIAREFGYTVEELLKPESPKAPEWYENIPEQGVLCWYGKDTRLVTRMVGTENEYNLLGAENEYGILANGLGIKLSKLTPFTDEEIESFKRGPKSNTEYMKGYAVGQASRDELIKKLVADNADLTQKYMDAIADMDLLNQGKWRENK